MLGLRVLRLHRLLVVLIAATSCTTTTEAPVGPVRPVRVYRSAPSASHDEVAARPPGPGAYDLGQLPVLSKVLFYLRANYFDQRRLDYPQMAMGALYFVQRDVPEVVIERDAARGELTVKTAGQQRVFSVQRIDQAWSMRAKLQEIFRFIQANLPPVAPEAEGPRLLEIETAAVNGMLYTLDPHSVLLDAPTYAQVYPRSVDVRTAAIGVVVRLESDGRVAVLDVQAGSPAEAAGVAAGDVITGIDDDSVQNMTLEGVMDRLRGVTGSKVEVTLERPGQRGRKKKTLVRAAIYARSVSPAPRLLDSKVGYLRLQHLGGEASLEVHEALQSFNRDGASGVILDLRGNKGGLYAQAVKVADEFVDQGTLVSMVGPGGSKRKDETATATAVTPQLPLVVLVDRQTASGAEIIAAALKNLDRGVVIGEPTFGMGSVQVLFDIPSPLAKGPDDRVMLGLKLTTAQMLAAGGAAIQDWGVAPDISTEAVQMPASDPASPVHLQASRHYRSERDYEKALPPQARRPGGTPAEAIRYFTDTREEAVPPDPETDPLVALAKQLLQQNKGFARHQLLAAEAAVVAQWKAEQEGRVGAALARRRIDWSSGPLGPPPPLQLTLARVEPPRGAPGRPILIRGTVKNLGSAPAFRVRAVIASDDGTFDEAELVFGQIAPGQSKSYDLSIAPPEPGRTSLLKATLIAGDRPVPGETELRVDVEGPPRATLAFRYQVVEGATGSNHDGRIEKGEPIEIPVTVSNRGPGEIAHLRATLMAGLPGPSVRIQKGRFELRGLAAGASQKITFTAVVDPSFAADHCPFKVVLEPDSGSGLGHALQVDLSAPSGVVAAKAADPVVDVDPPRVTVNGPAVATGGRVHIEATATSERGIRDVYIRVWNRNLKMPVEKVFYQLNQPPDGPQMSVAADIPVTRGLNAVQVFARDSNNLRSHEDLMVLREQ